MACGLKKQNTKGGVHLTERTCSPYNPIIKLMVDDCLGLPIYPVASVDSVIDEEGKTLRQLLAELQIEAQDGKISLETIDLIFERITNLEDDTEGLLNLKKLVNAISRLSALNGTGNVTIDDVPIIVKTIQEIQEQLGNEGNISSRLGALETLTSNLKALLVAIANCTSDNIQTYQFNNELEGEGDGNIISIVFKVLDLLDRVEELETAIGVTPGGNSLSSRVSALEENKSDRDDILLNLNIHQLSRNECPITGAYFYLPNSRDAVGNYGLGIVRYETPYYFAQGEVHNPSLRNWYDFMPFNSGRTESGWQVFTFNQSTNEYEPLKINGNNVYTGGDGKLSLAEVEFIIDVINDTSHEIQTYGKLYRKTEDGDYCELGNVNNDGETNVADINAYINALLSNTSSSLNSLNALLGFDLTTEVFGQIYNIARAHTELSITSRKQFLTSYIFIFHDEQNSKGIFVEDALITVEIYPLISNKLYLNLANNKVYSYIKGEMLPTSGSVEINLQRAKTELDGLIDIILEAIGELDDSINNLEQRVDFIDNILNVNKDDIDTEYPALVLSENEMLNPIVPNSILYPGTLLSFVLYTVKNPIITYKTLKDSDISNELYLFEKENIYLVPTKEKFYYKIYSIQENKLYSDTNGFKEFQNLKDYVSNPQSIYGIDMSVDVSVVSELITLILSAYTTPHPNSTISTLTLYKWLQDVIESTLRSHLDLYYDFETNYHNVNGQVSFTEPSSSDVLAHTAYEIYNSLITVLYSSTPSISSTNPNGKLTLGEFIESNLNSAVFAYITAADRAIRNRSQDLSGSISSQSVNCVIRVKEEEGTLLYLPVPLYLYSTDIQENLKKAVYNFSTTSTALDISSVSALISMILEGTQINLNTLPTVVTNKKLLYCLENFMGCNNIDPENMVDISSEQNAGRIFYDWVIDEAMILRGEEPVYFNSFITVSLSNDGLMAVYANNKCTCLVDIGSLIQDYIQKTLTQQANNTQP